MTDPRPAIDRRAFLQLGAAASGLAFGCGAAGREPESPAGAVAMRLRPLGRTGLEVSELSFGAHGVDNPPLMAAALEAGINTFGTSGQYLDGREEEALGRALRDVAAERERLVVVTGNPVDAHQSARSVLEDIDDSLRRLGSGHIDVYYAADLRSTADVRVDAFHEAIATAKQAGKVRHLGLSGHSGGMQAVLNAAIEDGRFEVFFIKYDFVSYPDLDAILERAAARGIGTIAFKTNAGNRQREVKELQAGGLSLREASVKWALVNPAVASVCVTFGSFDDIRQMTAAVGSRLTQAEAAMLRRYADHVRHRYCRFCAACEPTCPHGVAIADVNRYFMYDAYYDRHEEARRRYAALGPGRAAAACAGCGAPCEAACPFGRPVREELVEAHRRLV
jgi:predicted aldo/keto reductase-like oxidoreductase